MQKGPYPYISKEDTRKIDSTVHPAIKNAAFIYQSNIYYVPDFDKPVIQITKDGSAARFVKMSHDHSKFAYMNSLNNIVVVDDKGNNITTLTQYNQVKGFDWSADDKTLYILNNSTMQYYGPAMNLPAITYPGINGSELETLSASVSPNGDFAYVVHWFDFSYGDEYELIIKPANNGAVITYSDQEDNGYVMDYVNFTANTTDFIVGYGDPNGRQTRVKFFKDLHNYPTLTYGGTTTPTPIYNSTLNYLVGGAFNSATNTFAPAAICLGDPPVYVDANVPTSKILTQYSSASGNIYTDWK